MNKRIVLFLAGLALSASAIFAQKQSGSPVNMVINADLGKYTISKHLYGQFSEHLGRCIYEGIWVGENSSIPNTKGYRNDVLEALKNLGIPNLRWPGGCFADEYHWMDGIGPRDKRPKMINTNWGGVVEDNSFGTHEFLNFCEMIGTEPYISANVGSGTVEEMSKWVEYMTFDGESPMATLRKQNGREKPWSVKFIGVGNESWGCGGNMNPEFYADQFRRYNTYARNYGNNHLYRIASGASDYDYNWTDVLMRKAGNQMDGLSVHYYTVRDWNAKGSATQFSNEEYLATIEKSLGIDEVITKHCNIMDRYDPSKRVGLLVDEWGTWYEVEPGTNPGFLYQQNTLRDAIVAGMSLNIFNSHCDRVKMANIAQIINVLQSLILTDKEKMIVTPTYYVFSMYKVHQEATLLPLEFTSPQLEVNHKKFPAVSASASKDKNGLIHISLVNADPVNTIEILCNLRGVITSNVSGKILTAKELSAHNTFDKPNEIKPAVFSDAKIDKNGVSVKLPPKSVVVLELK
jgi:alpha-L-arabinofuranosidase